MVSIDLFMTFKKGNLNLPYGYARAGKFISGFGAFCFVILKSKKFIKVRSYLPGTWNQISSRRRRLRHNRQAPRRLTARRSSDHTKGRPQTITSTPAEPAQSLPLPASHHRKTTVSSESSHLLLHRRRRLNKRMIC